MIKLTGHHIRAGLMSGLIALTLVMLAATASWSAEKFPAPKGYVNDFAGVIDSASAQEMEAMLADLERRTTAEVAVVTVPDLGEFADVDEYAVNMFAAWKIGKKGEDNGVLVLLSMKERKVRIEVGYGLEGAITDGAAGDIIRDAMAPSFKTGEYGAGLLAGVRAIAAKIPPGGVQKAKKGGSHIRFIVMFVVFLLLIIS